jgi:hypothetical protein
MHIRARDAHAPHILGVSHPYSDRLFRRSYPWLLEWCAATVPNEKMKHLGVLPARNHDETIASSMAIATMIRNVVWRSAVYHRALSPRRPKASDRQASEVDLSFGWGAAMGSSGRRRGPWFAASSPAPAFLGLGSPRGACPGRVRTHD